jgi:hypothetical protein
MKRLLVRLLTVMLPLLSAHAFSAAEEAPVWPAPVGEVALQVVQSIDEASLLDVGVAIFDPGIPEDASTHGRLGVFPEIRKAEARYMPVVLRQVLLQSNAWGVVRVLPQQQSTLPELLVEATIIASDGLRLAVQVRVSDATGKPWLERIYIDESQPSDYPVAQDSDPYRDLYHSLANDMLSLRKSLSDRELTEIRRVALLRYSHSLSPQAFDGYLAGGDGSPYRVARLPAQGDPMVERVVRIRNQEYLFIDTVDEQYLSLSRDLTPTYNLWRQYGREQAIYREDYQQRVAQRDRQGRRGNFTAMQQTYNAYKWLKIQEQDLDELALGFNNEMEPTFLEVSGKLFRLTGTLDTQYGEWRQVLQDIFTLETGFPPTGVYASPDE